MKTALVTGAAKGIGRAIAMRLAQEGYDVAVHYNSSRAEARSTCAELEGFGVKAVALQADLRDSSQALELVQVATRELGGLGVLVNNVGNYLKKPLDALTIEDWHEMLNSNLNNTFYTCHAALPIMREQKYGRIINLGFAGTQHLQARPTVLPYVIAKTGVILLTKAIAQAEAVHGITANVVSPGVIENSVSKPLDLIPVGRLGTLEELSDAVWFLVQPNSSYITGQVLEVAGGFQL
jgi:3-oxoacyl-[acyl-carrier protein] reductase